MSTWLDVKCTGSTRIKLKNPLILSLFYVLIRLIKSDFLFLVVIKMSKKIILLSAIVMCTFIYGCGTSKDDSQQNLENPNEVSNTDIPVAEKNDWEPVAVQWWGRGGDTVEINETFGEDIN